MNFSFAGCGFLGIYHIGVASCLKEHAPHLLNGKIAGASAGAIVGCLVICGCSLEVCTRWLLRVAAKARARSLGPVHPSFDLTALLRRGLNEVLPSDAHLVVSGRLLVAMTRLSDGKRIVVTLFTSKEDLIQALLCSAFVPFYSGWVPLSFRGEMCIDGGLSDNLPRYDSTTITVCPFSGRSDICPDDDSDNVLHFYVANTSFQLSVANLLRLSRIVFPPHPESLSRICRRGFDDALKYLKANSLVSCSRHASTPHLKRVPTICTELYQLDGGVMSAGVCEDCNGDRRRLSTMVPRLPQSIVLALDEAVRAVNSSYVLSVKSTKLYWTASLLCSPLYLPADVTLLSIARMLAYVPIAASHVRRLYAALLLCIQRWQSSNILCSNGHDKLATWIGKCCALGFPTLPCRGIGCRKGIAAKTAADIQTRLGQNTAVTPYRHRQYSAVTHCGHCQNSAIPPYGHQHDSAITHCGHHHDSSPTYACITGKHVTWAEGKGSIASMQTQGSVLRGSVLRREDTSGSLSTASPLPFHDGRPVFTCGNNT